MGMEPAYPAIPASHLCDNRRIRPVQVGKASCGVRRGASGECREAPAQTLPGPVGYVAVGVCRAVVLGAPASFFL
jgi:hypothetical protein